MSQYSGKRLIVRFIVVVVRIRVDYLGVLILHDVLDDRLARLLFLLVLLLVVIEMVDQDFFVDAI